ncbi:MAG: AI-2E family transporter [Cellulosilyticum sp.]|nr:AI-2E family transporter [Cellulosilyticum sp.]
MQKLKQPFWLITYGLILFFFLLRFSTFSSVASQFFELVNPFLWGFALAYILNIPYEFFLKKMFKSSKEHKLYKMHRSFSLVLSYAVFFLGIAFIITLFIPQLLESINLFVANSGEYYTGLQAFFQDTINKLQLDTKLWKELENAIMSLANLLKNLLPSLVNIVSSAASSVFDLVCTLFISIYILASKDKLLNLIARSTKAFASSKMQKRLYHIVNLTNRTFRGFIVGQLSDALIVGLITFIGAYVLDFPYPVLLGFLAGITNVIPVIGPFIGAVPCVLIILMVNPQKVLWYIIFIVVLQQIDGNFICPLIVGDSTGLDGLWILFAIIVGGGFFGIVGCLLAVPIFAVLFNLYEELITTKLSEKVSTSSKK